MELKDNVTLRELTEEYRGAKVVFRRCFRDELAKSECTTYRFHGIISHACSLMSYVVKYKDSLEVVAIHDIKSMVPFVSTSP